MQQMKDGVMKLVKINQHIISENGKQDQDQQIEVVQESLYQIQETMKIGNGYDTVLNEQVNNFVNEVEPIKLNENAFSLRDEKISLIAASKQFQHTLNKSRKDTYLWKALFS